jgi:hypothetical protein
MVKLLLILGFISAMFGSLFATDELWNDSYYHFMEMAFVFYLLSFYLLSNNDSKRFSKLWQTITLIIVLCPISTLVDEIFYNALVVEWNDLFRFIFIVATSFKIKYKITLKYLWKTLNNF